MGKNNLNYFTVKDSKGKEIEYEILFTFESEETNKKYIVYTDNEKDAEGMIKTYASSYKEDPENKEMIKLEKIEDEKEWALVEKVLEQAVSQDEN